MENIKVIRYIKEDGTSFIPLCDECGFGKGFNFIRLELLAPDCICSICGKRELISLELDKKAILPLNNYELRNLYKDMFSRLYNNRLVKEEVFNDLEKNENWKKLSEEVKNLYYEQTLSKVLAELNIRKEQDAKKKMFKDEFKTVIGNFTDFLDMAHKFYSIQPYIYDKNKIWWLWNKLQFKWEMIDEIDLMNAIDAVLEHPSYTIQSKAKSEIIEALKRVGRLRAPTPVPDSWVQFKDRIVDIHTNEIFTASPNYFVTNPIPWELGQTDETPIMDKIFKEWVGEQYVQTLYEIIAYTTVPSYFIHRIFCFVGSGLNGKSKCLDLMRRFIGHENCTSTELDTIIKSRFELAKLYRKLICVMGETNFNELSRTSILKKITGQDLIGFEFKNKMPFDDYNYAKLIISTNSLPPTTDKTKGFYRRWMIIDFPNEFTEKKDILAEIPEIEYCNLARRCLSLLRVLFNERQFTNEGSLEDREERYESLSNPLEKFIKLHTYEDPNGHIFKFQFRDRFQAFCKENGFRIWNEKQIGSFMKDRFEDAKVEGDWNYEKKEKQWWRAWLGIRFKPTRQEESEEIIHKIKKPW